MSKYAIANPCAEVAIAAPVPKIGLITATCKVCDALLVGSSIEDIESQKCKTCGHIYGTEITTHIDNTEAAYDTHDRLNWYCSKCAHKGLAWKKMGEPLQGCPNCGAENMYMRVRRVDPIKGRCRSLWDNMSQPIPKSIPIHSPIPIPIFSKAPTISCPSCFTRNFIRHGKVPTHCNSCGVDLPKVKGIHNDNN